jgi:hypothetical protein
MPAHTEGHEGNFQARPQIQSLRMSGPLDGAPAVLATGHTLCCFVPRSVCYSGVDLADGLSLRTLSFSRPTTIVGPILDTVVISCDVEDVIYEE